MALSTKEYGKVREKRNKEGVEPVVVDEELIKHEIKRYNEENKILNQDLIEFNQLRVLCLSYQNILKIQNLQGLQKQEKLYLDNNIISQIEGLNHLDKLQWLDLSFNCIKEVGNLDQLVNLTDQSLYSNQIEKVQNQKELQKQNVLSLGNNKIEELGEMLRHVKKLKKLEVLNIANNPFTRDCEFKNYIIYNLPEQKYLDYAFIDEDVKKGIPDDDKYKVDRGDEDTKEEGKMIEEENERKRFGEAKIDPLMNYEKRILEEPEDFVHLLRIKGAFEESVSKFQEGVKALIDSIKTIVFKIQDQKNAVIKKFESILSNLEKDAEGDSLEMLRIYQKKKKHVDRACENKIEDREEGWSESIDNIIDYLDGLDYELMTREILLSKSAQKIFDEMLDAQLKNIYSELETNAFGDEGLKKVEELQNEFFSKFMDEAMAEAERLEKVNDSDAKDQDGGADYDDVGDRDYLDMGLLENKDDLRNNINSIKEHVDNRHRNTEQEIRNKISQEKGDYMKSVQKRLNEQNRKNVQNIIKFIEGEIKYWKEKQIIPDTKSEDDSDDEKKGGKRN